jgi:hypothetical protein
MVSNAKIALREKLHEDISELSVVLQNILKKGLEKGYVTEDSILSGIDDIDKQVEILERFYELTDKLSIKIETIDDILLKEMNAKQ